MKRIPLILLVLFLVPLPASAQETYSILLAAANVTKLDLGRVQHNASTCASVLLPASCTQAEACVVEPQVTGGAACTPADALAANRRIYTNTLSGRENFIRDQLIKTQLDGYVVAKQLSDLEAFRAFCRAANQTQADAICTAGGLSAGCGVCLALK